MQDAEARPDPVERERHDTAAPQRVVRRYPTPARLSQPPATLTFTHQDKVMFPKVGITKGDVLRFYARIAPRLFRISAIV